MSGEINLSVSGGVSWPTSQMPSEIKKRMGIIHAPESCPSIPEQEVVVEEEEDDDDDNEVKDDEESSSGEEDEFVYIQFPGGHILVPPEYYAAPNEEMYMKVVPLANFQKEVFPNIYPLPLPFPEPNKEKNEKGAQNDVEIPVSEGRASAPE